MAERSDRKGHDHWMSDRNAVNGAGGCADRYNKATAIAGSVIGPAVIGMTLGIVKQAGFNRQNGFNQAYNHAGNMVGAALSGWLGFKFGMPAIFLLAAFFGILSILSVLLIPGKAIDNRAARGMKDGEDGDGKPSGLKVLLQCRPLLILGVALVFFHLAMAVCCRFMGWLRPAETREILPFLWR